MFLTQRVLRFRHKHPDLFAQGTYVPINLTGTFADCAVSFARSLKDQWLIVIAPRLSSRVGFHPIGEKWQDTAVEIPGTIRALDFRSVFTAGGLRMENGKLMMREALSSLPFAAITNAR